MLYPLSYLSLKKINFLEKNLKKIAQLSTKLNITHKKTILSTCEIKNNKSLNTEIRKIYTFLNKSSNTKIRKIYTFLNFLSKNKFNYNLILWLIT
jgi:hypothetical protein